MTARIIEKDRGWKRIQREIRKGRSPRFVAVGVLENEAAAQHGDGGVTLGEVATFNELGTKTIPARSFVRSTVDENETTYRKRLAQLGGRVAEGKISGHTALAALGEQVVADIRRKITDGIPPPNAPSTIAKKGSSTPLIDKGQLRQAISYEVRD